MMIKGSVSSVQLQRMTVFKRLDLLSVEAVLDDAFFSQFAKRFYSVKM